MAIEAIAHQNITIDTPFMLDVNITGNPTHAWVEGLLEGFSTEWDDPTLRVRGAATRLINNSPFTVHNSNGESRSSTFSVNPAAPVITDPGKQTLVRGLDNEFIVKVANSPASLRAEGPWAGLKYEPHESGIRIFGKVPDIDSPLTVPDTNRSIRVTAETGSLVDTLAVGFDLIDPLFAYIHSSKKVYIVPAHSESGTVLTSDDILRKFNVSSNYNIEDMALEDDNLYLLHRTLSNPRVYLVDRGTANNTTASATQDWSVHYYSSGTERVIALDSNNAYVMPYSKRVYIVSRAFERQSNFIVNTGLTNTLSPGGVIDGNNLYWTIDNDYISVVQKNSSGNNVSPSRIFRLPYRTGSTTVRMVCSGMDIIGNDLYLLVRDGSLYKLIAVNKNTANSATATVKKVITLPSDIVHPRGLVLSLKN